MERRDFIMSSALGAGSLMFGFPVGSISGFGYNASSQYQRAARRGDVVNAGWINDPYTRDRWVKNQKYPFLNDLDADIRGTGAGRVVLLYKFLESILGHPIAPYSQAIGDCVGMGFARGVDILTAIQIGMRNAPQRWRGEAATEIIYAGSRVEAGSKYGHKFRGDGSLGVLAADFIKNWGVLLRQPYLGKYDFTTYSGAKARKLGRSGVPDALEPLCKLHPVGYTALVNSWEEARDCIANGFPVALCSGQGFKTNRGLDKDGFLAPGGNWQHCMLLGGIDDKYSRPGGLIINSWGCHCEQTEILTDQGWKFFKDLNRTEKVATLNQKTHEFQYETPTQYHRYPYKGNLWSFKSGSIDFAVTPNHNLYVRRHKKDWELTRADECIQTVEFKKDAKNTNKDVKYYKVGNHKIDMDLWLEFLGYYISEGSAGIYKSEAVYTQTNVVISQCKKESRKIMWECLQQLPFKFNKNKRRFIHCQQSELVHELLPLGKSYEKYLPEYIWNCSKRQLRVLYTALMLGDGSVRHKKTGITRTYYTSSKKLADDFQCLLLHCGYCGDITSYNRVGYKTKTGIIRHISYCVNIKQIATTPRPTGGYKPILLPYEGEVFCVTTDSGVIYTRRNGKAMWGGNSFVNGPRRHGQPNGSFWADASVIDRMTKQGDSIALSSYRGYPKNNYFFMEPK